jgi:hypothetical protein
MIFATVQYIPKHAKKQLSFTSNSVTREESKLKNPIVPKHSFILQESNNDE